MKRKINARKGVGKDGEKVSFSSFLPLMHHELTKSFPLITARKQRGDWVRVW